MVVHDSSLPYDELLSSLPEGMDVDAKRQRATAECHTVRLSVG